VTIPTDRKYLTEKRYATLIVRLLLDRRGQLISGELLDAESLLGERFIGVRGLIRTVRTWLARQAQSDDSDGA
jgi:hypothetical protein